MLENRKFLLVTDSSHPEIFAIANSLSKKMIPFTLITGFVFSRTQLKWFNRVPFIPNSVIDNLERRSIDTGQASNDLHRIAIFNDFLSKLLNKFPNSMRGDAWNKLVTKLDNFLKFAYRSKAIDILKQGKFSHVIYLSGLNVETLDESLITVEIAFHGNSTQEVFWRDFAKFQYPEWESTWKIADPRNGHKTAFSSSTFLPHKIVYASSFNSFSSQNGIESIYSPLGGVKTGRMYPHLKARETSLIHVGQLNLRKGIPLILEVASRLPVKFILCGNGSAEAISKIQISRNPLIELALNPSDQEIRERLASSQIFVLPSYYEGFGIAILEAMSYGCIPIVSTNTCGPDILLGTELEKFLIAPGSISELENAIRKVLDLDLSERIRLGEIAATISRKFTLAAYGERVTDNLLK